MVSTIEHLIGKVSLLGLSRMVVVVVVCSHCTQVLVDWKVQNVCSHWRGLSFVTLLFVSVGLVCFE
jgi:hypothetical protein